MADRKLSQDMAGAWGLMRQKEKVLMILQSILTAILLIFIIIGVGMGMNKGWILKTELGIVIVLFVLNALKAYPERKKAIVFYIRFLLELRKSPLKFFDLFVSHDFTFICLNGYVLVDSVSESCLRRFVFFTKSGLGFVAGLI